MLGKVICVVPRLVLVTTVLVAEMVCVTPSPQSAHVTQVGKATVVNYHSVLKTAQVCIE